MIDLYEWLRGKVIQNYSFYCLCHLGKAKYVENNILKYLIHLLKISRLGNQHIFISLLKLILVVNGKVI